MVLSITFSSYVIMRTFCPAELIEGKRFDLFQVQVSSLVSVQLNHFQFLFLMRMLETFSEITTFLTQDVSHILGEMDESRCGFKCFLEIYADFD